MTKPIVCEMFGGQMWVRSVFPPEHPLPYHTFHCLLYCTAFSITN